MISRVPAKWPPAALAAALAAAAAAVYAPALGGALQYDDGKLVDEPRVVTLSTYAEPATWLSALAGGRPLTELTFALNHAASGFEPFALHPLCQRE